jgi:hypothetical protein
MASKRDNRSQDELLEFITFMARAVRKTSRMIDFLVGLKEFDQSRIWSDMMHEFVQLQRDAFDLYMSKRFDAAT